MSFTEWLDAGGQDVVNAFVLGFGVLLFLVAYMSMLRR